MSDAPPLRAGRYELAEVLGMGAMGIVYAAYDPELGRRIACKLLRPATDDPRAQATRQRFVREAKSLARVVHPNVVAIYDAGEINEQTFIAMELVPGGTLRDWLQRGPHGLDDTLALFEQVGRGLGAVHKAGLVHRDFKPENILLGEDGRPRVTDFGLAQMDLSDGEHAPVEPARPSPVTLTQTALAGTPVYMAPEQLRAEPVDVRSDVFAFCVVLYEALHGTRPFAGNSVTELERSIATGELLRSMTAKRLPPALSAALRRGLAANPGDRFATLDELLAILRRVRQPRRALGRTSTLAMLTLALIGGVIGVSAWRAHPRVECSTDRMATAYAPATRAALLDHLKSGGSPAALTAAEVAAVVLDQYVALWRQTSVEACRDTYERRQQSELTFDARTECLLRDRHRFELTLSTLRADDQAYLHAIDIIGQLHAPEQCLLPRPTTNASGDKQKRPAVEDALDRAYVASIFGRTSSARDEYTNAEHLAEAAGLQHELAEALIGSATATFQSGGKAEMLAPTHRGIALAVTNHDYQQAVRGWLLLVQLNQRHLADALSWAELARWGIERSSDGALAPTDQRITTMLAENVSGAYLLAGKHSEAEATLRAAMPHVDQPSLSTRLEQSLADVLTDNAQFADAEAMLNQARAHAVTAYGADSLAVLGVDGSLSNLEYARFGAAAALPRLRRVVAAYERFGVDQAKSTAVAYGNLASFLGQADQPAEALVTARRAYALASQALPEDDPLQLDILAIFVGALLDAHAAHVTNDAHAARVTNDAHELVEARTMLDRAQAMAERMKLGEDAVIVSIDRDAARIMLEQHVSSTNRARAKVRLAHGLAIARRYEARPDMKPLVKDIEALRHNYHLD